MPLTNYGEPYCLQALFGGVTSGIPASSSSWYVGLITTKTTYTTVGTWTASTRYAVGDVIIPNAFSSTNHIYYVSAISGTGTSGSTEPTWPTTAAGTVVDNSGANQITWTEATTWLYTSSNITSLEVSTSSTAYARQAITQSQGASTFVAPTTPASASPASTQYGSNIAFTASTASWGYVVGFFLATASTGGNALAWNTLSNFVPMLASGMTMTLPSSGPGLKITLA